MKIIVIILLIVFTCLTGRAEGTQEEYKFSFLGMQGPDPIYRLFNDKVSIKSMPDENSEIIATLPIAHLIKPIKREDKICKMNDYRDYWYLVEFEYKGKKNKGYICGGQIAKVFIHENIDDDENKECVLIGIIKKTKDNESFQARVVKEDKIISKVSFDPFERNMDWLFDTIEYYCITAELISDKGFDPDIKIVKVGFLLEACGSSYDIILIWNKRQLSYGLMAESNASEIGEVYYDYIYPNDKDGEKNHLILKCTASTEGYEPKISYERYLWDGSSLILKKNK